MSDMKSCCLVGRGKAYTASANTGLSWGYNWGFSWSEAPTAVNAGRFIGNVTSLNIRPQHTFRTRASAVGFEGGTDCSVSILESVEVDMTISCHSSSNLADALFGSVKQQKVPLPAVSDEIILPPEGGIFEPCSFIAFQNPGVDTSTIVLVDETTSTTLVEGTDYNSSPTGIELINGFSGNLRLSYSYSKGFECVEAFTGSGNLTQLIIDGFNLANNNEQIQVRLYKVRFSPTSDFTVIGDDFSELTLTGILEPVTIDNERKFFSIKRILD